MRLTADQTKIAEACAWASRALPPKPQVPALAGLHLIAADGRLSIAAFDGDTGHTATIDAEIHEPGEALIPGRFLAGVLSSLRTGQVGLETDADAATIDSGRSRYKIRALRDEGRPLRPEVGGTTGSVEADDLRRLIAAVRHPIDASSPWDDIAGVRIEADADTGLQLVGMSRSRLEHARADWVGDPLAVTVPLSMLEQALGGMSGTVHLGPALGLLGLEAPGRSVVLRTMAGEFAPFGRFLRSADLDEITVMVDADELAGALRRAAAILTDEETAVLLRVAGGELHLSALDAATASEGFEVLDAEATDEVRLGVRARYLLDALTGITGRARLGIMRTERTPVTVRAEAEAERDQRVAVLMPMKIPAMLEGAA